VSDLDALTKDELLAYAEEAGVEVSASWTKAQIREAIDNPEIGLTVTTTKTKDYLNRALTNTIPGTSNATDFLGRNVVTGDKDYLGRGLVT
jgi:hypothetical protein